MLDTIEHTVAVTKYAVGYRLTCLHSCSWWISLLKAFKYWLPFAWINSCKELDYKSLALSQKSLGDGRHEENNCLPQPVSSTSNHRVIFSFFWYSFFTVLSCCFDLFLRVHCDIFWSSEHSGLLEWFELSHHPRRIIWPSESHSNRQSVNVLTRFYIEKFVRLVCGLID